MRATLIRQFITLLLTIAFVGQSMASMNRSCARLSQQEQSSVLSAVDHSQHNMGGQSMQMESSDAAIILVPAMVPALVPAGDCCPDCDCGFGDCRAGGCATGVMPELLSNFASQASKRSHYYLDPHDNWLINALYRPPINR